MGLLSTPRSRFKSIALTAACPLKWLFVAAMIFLTSLRLGSRSSFFCMAFTEAAMGFNSSGVYRYLSRETGV